MRSIKFWSVTILSLLVVFGLIGFGWLRSSLPKLDGNITLAGLEAPVTIARDAHGIPHIGAASDHDLYFALGFVHGQDRLWQMEMNRRIGHGRVAEVVGDAGVPIDKYFRTLGFTERATSAFANLGNETREALEAYAAGVNAYLENRTGALPPEFLLTGIRPEPWSPIDTLVWQKMMWLDLSGNSRLELARARLLTQLSPDQVAALYPDYPGETFPALPELSEIFGKSGLESAAAFLGPMPPEGYGSNNWVVSGDRTKSGKPLLANDPHLGLTTPSIWYLVHLRNSTTGKNLVGVGFPGTPSIILGRNDRVAWGFTNTAPDVQDLFIEKLEDGGKSYLTPDGPAPFMHREERIKVKGGDEIIMTVLETRHGPVVSDVMGDRNDFLDEGYVLAMQWTALQETDSVITGLLNLARVESFEDFKAAGHHYFGPEQNMIYADIDGNIGYYAPALVPIRHADNKIMGRLPSPGWDALYDWQGYIPFEELPTRYNPEGGIIATANEKIVDDDYPHFITGDWSLPYRGNRIRAQLAATPKHDQNSFDALQSDIVSDMARELMPVFAFHLKGEGEIADMLSAWDGSMAADQPEPLIFHELIRHYQALLINDELGDLADDFTSLRTRLLHDTLYHEAVASGASFTTDYYNLPPIETALALPWCDNVSSDDVVELCGDLARQALAQAVAALETRHGKDWKSWRWGSEHILTQSHRPMGQVPFIKRFFEIETPISGSRHTVNVAGVSDNPGSLNSSSFGPSYRGIFDLSNLDASLYVQPTGQSGNPLSPHYDDLFPLWKNGDYLTIPIHRNQTPNSQHLLRLKPDAGMAASDSP